MKKLLTLSIMLIFSSAISFGQIIPGEKMVPKVVKDQFAKDFPDASIKNWVKKAGPDYRANMIHDNKNAWVRYSSTGKMKWVGHSWKGHEIPANILNPILEQYPDFTANWATETDNKINGKHQFLVRLSKPGFVLKVLMNADGTFAHEDSEDLKSDK